MLLYYIQTNVFCIILFLIIFLDVRRRDATKDQKIFYFFMLDAVLFCLADMLNYSLMGINEPYIKPLLYVIDTVYFSTSVIASYIWYLYTLEKLEFHKVKRHIIRYLMFIPVVIFIIITSLSPILGWIFRIDENNIYQRGSALWIHWIIAWGYIVVATVLTMIYLVKEKDRNRRRIIIPLFSFAIFPVISSIIQIFIPNASLIQVGMVLSSVIVCIKIQDNHAITDTLTGLYNRSYFDKYLEERIKLLDDNTSLFLIMMDVDDLKGINVLMGRKRGDEILKNLGYLVNRITHKYTKVNVSRYEGDEFAIFGYGYELNDIKEIAKFLEDGVHELNLKSSFSVDVTIGYIKGTKNSFMNVDQIIDLADIEMHKIQEDKIGLEKAQN